jgi:predicted transcriptional regulator
MRTVVLEVQNLHDSLADVASAMQSGKRESEAHISFATPELLWRVLTEKRWRLLQAMAGQEPMAIREVARRVGRDVKAVHGDVHALLRAGVLERGTGGRVVFPYGEVRVEFVLRAA